MTGAPPRLFAAALAAVLLAPLPAGAHSAALSGFEVYAGERDLRVEFKLDAPSVRALLEAAHPDRRTELAAIPAERAAVFEYLRARFHVTNDGQPCPPRPMTELAFHQPLNKVLVEARYDCPGELDRLALRSTIFDEEANPQIVCNFHYGRALEHYFFSKGIPLAEIRVRQLRQVLPAIVDQDRPAAMAEPPPGAGIYEGETPASTSTRPAASLPGFVAKGVMHILGGLDHVLFVVSLVIAVRTRRELVLIVSSFTIAHSISLVLGTFDLVVASPRLVEPLIALSIIYVAVENVVRRADDRTRVRRRLAVTFAFGLVHGLGFSAALRELGLPARALVAPLVGFNVGVELGQLAIVLPLLPLVVWLRGREPLFRRASLATNSVVALVACGWFVQRLAGW
jgi:hydrogenase/urease accessory protein HupE